MPKQDEVFLFHNVSGKAFAVKHSGSHMLAVKFCHISDSYATPNFINFKALKMDYVF